MREINAGDTFLYCDEIWVVVHEFHSDKFTTKDFHDDCDFFHAFCLGTYEVTVFDRDDHFHIMEQVGDIEFVDVTYE